MNPYAVSSPLPRKHAQEVVKVSQQDLMRDISSSESLMERALYPFGGNPDPVARRKGIKIYQEMTQDDQVKACLDLRKQARLSTPWNIVSAKEGDATADMYAEFVKHVFERMQGTFEDKLYQIYSATEFGFSVTEKVYEFLPDGKFAGKIALKELKTREPYNYDFKTDVYGNLLGIVYNGAMPAEARNENGTWGARRILSRWRSSLFIRTT